MESLSDSSVVSDIDLLSDSVSDAHSDVSLIHGDYGDHLMSDDADLFSRIVAVPLHSGGSNAGEQPVIPETRQSTFQDLMDAHLELQNYPSGDGVDCDFFSIRILVEDLPIMATQISLCHRGAKKIDDPRLADAIMLSSSPFCLFIVPPMDIDIERFMVMMSDEFYQRGVIVVLNDDPKLFSRSPGRRIDSHTVSDVFNAVGLEFCYVYGFGGKMNQLATWAKFDNMAIRGGAPDNLFDIGTSFRENSVRIFRPTRAAKAKNVRVPIYGRIDEYAVFKHIGGGFGSIHGNFDGKKTRIYQLMVHYLKAADFRLGIPRTGKEGKTYLQRFSDVLYILERWGTKCGGFRIEVRQSANCLTIAASAVAHMLDPIFWFESPIYQGGPHCEAILEHRSIDVDHVFSECKFALDTAKSLGIFRKANQARYNFHEQVVFADLSNLLGWAGSNRSSFWLLKKTGFQLYPYVFWTDGRRNPHGDSEIGFDRRIMAQQLEYRNSGLHPGHWTLTSRRTGAEWTIRWSCGPDLLDILTCMVNTVIDENVMDWSTRFRLRESPLVIETPIEEGLPFGAVVYRSGTRELPGIPDDDVMQDFDLSGRRGVPFNISELNFVQLSGMRPPWATVNVPEFILDCIRNMSPSRRAVRYVMEEDLLILEFIYQKRLTGAEPGNVLWSLMFSSGFSHRKPQALKARWAQVGKSLYAVYEPMRSRGAVIAGDEVIEAEAINIERNMHHNATRIVENADLRDRSGNPDGGSAEIPIPNEQMQVLRDLVRRAPGFTLSEDVALITAVIVRRNARGLAELADAVATDKTGPQCQARLRNVPVRGVIDHIARTGGFNIDWRSSTR
jgi:hypothetical protein